MTKSIGPKIYPLDRDLTKTWFVKYPNPNGGQPLKKYGNLAHCLTLEQKLAEAYRIIQEEIVQDKQTTQSIQSDTFVEDLSNFFKFKKMGLRSKSQATYDSHVSEFVRWYRLKWRNEDIGLMGMHFLLHLKAKGASNTTINNYRATIKSIFGKLVAAKKFALNPFEITDKLPERRQTKEWFRQEQMEEVKALINGSNPQLWLGCRLQYYCFIRPNSEMPHLKVGDLKIAEKQIRIRAEIGKTSTRDEYVNIPDDMMAEMARFIDYPDHYYIFSHGGKPGPVKLGKDNLSRQHMAYMKQLKMPKGYTYYSWKNTGAVHMFQAGISILDISEMMRHKSLDYTKFYFESLGFKDRSKNINNKLPKI